VRGFLNADPANQPIGNGAAPGSGELGGQIDLFSPDFKLPQRLSNIGVDQQTGIRLNSFCRLLIQ
jgi:hypothetical protein